MNDNKLNNNRPTTTIQLENERPTSDRLNDRLTPCSDRDSELERVTERDLLRELLRQARLSFNSALAVIIASSLISIIGVGLLLSGRVSEGRAAAAGGLASKAVSWGLLKLAKDSSDRLDADLQNLKK